MLKDEIIKIYGNKVRLRVCGVLKIKGEVLLISHQLENNDSEFWSLPGGGIEYGETIEECLKREFKEETNLEIRIGNFITIYEHIKAPLHAVELYYNIYADIENLSTGNDPEHTIDNQNIKNCTLKNLNSIKNDKKNTYHPILFQLISKK